MSRADLSDVWGGRNPGSNAAIAEGCICARMDNNRGIYAPHPPSVDLPNGAWWITEGCPTHAPTGPVGAVDATRDDEAKNEGESP